MRPGQSRHRYCDFGQARWLAKLSLQPLHAAQGNCACCQAARLNQHHRLGGCHKTTRDLLSQLFTKRYIALAGCLLASLKPEDFFQRLPLSLASPKCQICPGCGGVNNVDFRPSPQQGKDSQQVVQENATTQCLGCRVALAYSRIEH